MFRMFLRQSLVRADGSTMPSPAVRVNTFVQGNEIVYIDPISKIFIISEAVFGYFRLPLIRNRKLHYMLAVFYSLVLNGTLSMFIFVWTDIDKLNVMMICHIFQYIFCCLFGFLCMKKLQLYYSTLNRFDMEVGCRPKVSQHSLQNLAQTVLTVVLYCLLFTMPKYLQITNAALNQFLIMHIASTFETNYYGHLLNILVPRLKLINYYIESSLSGVKSESSSLMKEFVSLKRTSNADLAHYRMKMLMDLYHIMVEAYDFLIDAIKWQLLVSIISSFLSILGFLYWFSLSVIKGGRGLIEGVLLQLLLSVLIMIPLFSPCTFGDKVHHEVKRLRELLASRLYENKLDKSGRSIARALLAFTETRDLSFRLLRMLNIDISLPFKFMGLLVTYLIILLQFEKVINPGLDTVANKTIK